METLNYLNQLLKEDKVIKIKANLVKINFVHKLGAIVIHKYNNDMYYIEHNLFTPSYYTSNVDSFIFGDYVYLELADIFNTK